MRTIFYQAGADTVHEQYERYLAQLTERFPDAKLLEVRRWSGWGTVGARRVPTIWVWATLDSKLVVGTPCSGLAGRRHRREHVDLACVVPYLPSRRLEVRIATRLSGRGAIGTGSQQWALTAVSMAGLLAVYGSWQVFHWGPSTARQPIANAFFYLVTGTAVLTAWSASRRSDRSPRLRRAWRLFALGLFFQLAGQVAFQVYGLLGEKPYPSIADALYLDFYPLMLVGLLSLPAAPGRVSSSVRLAVDLAVVAIGGSAAVVYLVLGPTVVAGSGSALQVGFSVAYPVGDLVLLVGLASVLTRGSAVSAWWALRLFVAGVVLFVLGDLVYGYATLHSGYQSGDPIDTAWMVALALMAVAGTTQRASGRVEFIEGTRERIGWLPPAAVAFGFGMLLFSLRHEALFPGLVMVVIAIVLAGLVLARQVLVQRDLVHAQEALRHQAFHDALTGLPNRMLVLDRAEQLLANARRHDLTVPAFFLDIDGFKGVNDTLGHAAGDKLLQTVAVRLEGVLRESDTVGRLGGDEFVILLDPATLTVSPEVVAERVLAAIREPIDLAGASAEPRSITASIGIAMGQHSSPDELLRAADLALYRAKAGGRNRHVLLEPARGIIAGSAGTFDASSRGSSVGNAGSPEQPLGEHYLRAIVDCSFELLMVVDGERTVRWANAAVERALGCSHDAVVGRNLLAFFHPDDLPALAEAVGQLSAVPGAAQAVDARMRASDGSWHMMETVGTNMLDDAAIGGFVFSMRDVTERRQMEALLRERDTQYGELFEGARDAIYVADLDGRLRLVNAAAERLTGYSRIELLEMSLMELVAPDDVKQATDVLAQRIAGDSEEPFELRLVRKDGIRVFAEVTGRVVAPESGQGRLEGIVRDTTDRHRLEEQLRCQSLHDMLTGLANRTLLRDRLAQALARGERDDSRVAVLLLDLDDFKVVNNSLGHEAGDGILVALAERLRLLLRAGETVARLDGDEFAVVAEGVRDRRDVVALARRIQSVFAEPFVSGETSLKMAGSLGVTITDENATSGDLLRDADIAMYRAKATARGGFAFFDPVLRAELLRHLTLDKALEHALRNHELEIQYQPIVSLTGGTIVAVEALARWLHPTLGRVEPDEFIPAAEESGLIQQLGRYVITEAARQAAQWRRIQPGTLPLGVFVNVSARELADPGFARFVAETLNKYDLVAADISLELTERVFIDDRDTILNQNLADLTASGTRIVLDDFGTGYSALASLKRFPLAAVKIDRYFIASIQRPNDEAPITRAITGLCETLGLTVIAEGVETQIQLDFLRRLGCDAAQGFLLGRPASASETTRLLSRSPVPAAPGRNTPHTGKSGVGSGSLFSVELRHAEEAAGDDAGRRPGGGHPDREGALGGLPGTHERVEANAAEGSWARRSVNPSLINTDKLRGEMRSAR